jgi:uncharacterized protein involved in response to NO
MALKPLNGVQNPATLKPVLPLLHAVPPTAPLDAAWRARWLLAAPHRLAFMTGAFLLALSALWWCVLLWMRLFGGNDGVHVPWAVSPNSAHALVMGLGFFPLFFAGFLFTAGPKWLGMPEVPARQLLPQMVMMVLGWAVCLLGFHVSHFLVATGLMAVASAWTSLTIKFGKLWHASRAPDKAHASVVVVASALGALAMWVVVAGMLAQAETMVRSATQAALWIFIATVFATVSHRMIPFFSASSLPFLDAWRPLWLLWCMVGVLCFEGVVACSDLWLWPSPQAWRWLQVSVEAPAAALLLWLAIRWGLVQSLKIRMLAMLHGGFLWLGIALALQAASHTLMALTQDQTSLGLAPLHAMTMGYLGATMFAMATRVSSGHSGRPLAADNIAWGLYWMVQLAVLLRVVHALWPNAGAWPLLSAIAAWTLACCGWALRYGNWFGRPRADGRAG